MAETLAPNDDVSGVRLRTMGEMQKLRNKARKKAEEQGKDPDAIPQESNAETAGSELSLVSRALGEFPADLIWFVKE